MNRSYSEFSKVALGLASAAVLAMATISSTASAATTTGIAVANTASSTQVGLAPVFNAELGANAIPYFIPLGNGSGTYGVGANCGGNGFGTCADSGNGGGTLTMNLYFNPVSTANPSVLTVNFADLDLNGVNSPAGFLETVNVLDASSTSLTGGVITNIGGLITGDANSQVLTLALGTLTSSPLWLVMQFTASFTSNGTNTTEFLIAQIDEVPLPGALLLFGSVVAGGWGVRKWRERRSTLKPALA